MCLENLLLYHCLHLDTHSACRGTESRFRCALNISAVPKNMGKTSQEAFLRSLFLILCFGARLEQWSDSAAKGLADFGLRFQIYVQLQPSHEKVLISLNSTKVELELEPWWKRESLGDHPHLTSALWGGNQKEDDVREVACILYCRSVSNADKGREGFQHFAEVMYEWSLARTTRRLQLKDLFSNSPRIAASTHLYSGILFPLSGSARLREFRNVCMGLQVWEITEPFRDKCALRLRTRLRVRGRFLFVMHHSKQILQELKKLEN